MPELRDLLEMRVAAPADFSADGETLLVASDLTGTMQLYRVPRGGGELEQLTDFSEPVAGEFVPGSGRIQLYLLDVAPGAEPEPLVCEPDFIHRAPALTRDGGLVAYACNRRNGVDFDICVRSL